MSMPLMAVSGERPKIICKKPAQKVHLNLEIIDFTNGNNIQQFAIKTLNCIDLASDLIRP